jgi:hypothetical protein
MPMVPDSGKRTFACSLKRIWCFIHVYLLPDLMAEVGSATVEFLLN